MQYFWEFAQGAKTVLPRLVYKSKFNAPHFVVLSDYYLIFLPGYAFIEETHNCIDRWKKMEVLMAKLCLIFVTLWTVAHQLFCPWNSPGKNSGVVSHPLLEGIFLTQGLNPGFLHCRQSLPWRHEGSSLSLSLSLCMFIYIRTYI